MKIKDPQLEERLKNLNNELFEIRSIYLVWRELEQSINTTVTEKNLVNENLSVQNRHIGFFGPVINSLRQSLVINLARLFDKRRDTESIPKVLDELKKYGLDFNDEYNSLSKEYAADLTQIKRVRDTYDAHRALHADPGLLPSIIAFGELIERLSKFLSRVSGEAFGSYWAYQGDESLQATRDTSLLLRTLKDGVNSRLTAVDARENI